MIDAETALNWLAENRDCELSFGYNDGEERGEWQIHRVNGGVNDREWKFLAYGQTPLEALINAMEVK